MISAKWFVINSNPAEGKKKKMLVKRSNWWATRTPQQMGGK
jgi:hypothetical protein